jgi:hypothetical protein
MSRRDAIERRLRKNKLPPFVPLLKETMDAPAWKAMSHGARSLYASLKRFYSINDHNNGRLFLSQRDAAEAIGSHHNEIARWYRELLFYGFIVQMTSGGLGVDGVGKAPHWRLTELGYMGDEPTRDFLKWDGIKFQDRKSGAKTKPRAGNGARGVLEKAHTGVPEMAHSSLPKRAGKGAHSKPLNRAGNGARTSIPLSTSTSAAVAAPSSPQARASVELLASKIVRPVDPFAIDEDLSIPTFLDRRREVAR